MATKARANPVATTLDLGGAVAAAGGGAKGLYRDGDTKAYVPPQRPAPAAERARASERERERVLLVLLLLLVLLVLPPMQGRSLTPLSFPLSPASPLPAGRRATTSCTTSASCAAAPTRCP